MQNEWSNSSEGGVGDAEDIWLEKTHAKASHRQAVPRSFWLASSSSTVLPVSSRPIAFSCRQSSLVQVIALVSHHAPETSSTLR